MKDWLAHKAKRDVWKKGRFARIPVEVGSSIVSAKDNQAYLLAFIAFLRVYGEAVGSLSESQAAIDFILHFFSLEGFPTDKRHNIFVESGIINFKAFVTNLLGQVQDSGCIIECKDGFFKFVLKTAANLFETSRLSEKYKSDPRVFLWVFVVLYDNHTDLDICFNARGIQKLAESYHLHETVAFLAEKLVEEQVVPGHQTLESQVATLQEKNAELEGRVAELERLVQQLMKSDAQERVVQATPLTTFGHGAT